MRHALPGPRGRDSRLQFSLLLEGPDVLSEDVFRALEERCEDAVFGHRAGIQFADFERQAGSFAEAVLSAIEDVESAVKGLRVIRVEPDELVTPAVIASRIGRTPQNVNQLIKGTRGRGDFPSPVAWVDAKTRLWRWSDVVQWFALRGEPVSKADLAIAEFVAMLNGRLEARRHEERLGRLREADVEEAERALAASAAARI